MRVAGPNSNVIKAIESGDITLVPERFKKISLDWLANEYDWNISRQNWFGIRIPVFYKTSNDPEKDPYLVTADESEAKSYYGEGNYRAETDVFDTWYSSGQWPYATLQATGDYEKFYPTSVMETGRDILTKWVTKMAMFGLYRTGQVPFKTVYLHGLINDEHGKKMSKSKGNVINPLTMTAKFGTDALRLALTIGITPGNDGALSEAKIEGYRNFNNKLWNVARFILGTLPGDYSPAAPKLSSPADHWISYQSDRTVQTVTRALEEYRFSDAGQLVYSLLWDDFADWYLEASKVSPNHDLLIDILETILKLVHPIAPFVSEAIWGQIAWHKEQLITTEWPVVDTTRTDRLDLVGDFDDTISVVQAARTVIAEEQLTKPVILTTDAELAEAADLVKRLARASDVKLVKEGSGLYLGTAVPAWIEADHAQIEARRHRLEAARAEKVTHLKSLDAKLANTRYVESAPAKVVDETRKLQVETAEMIRKLTDQLSKLS